MKKTARTTLVAVALFVALGCGSSTGGAGAGGNGAGGEGAGTSSSSSGGLTQECGFGPDDPKCPAGESCFCCTQLPCTTLSSACVCGTECSTSDDCNDPDRPVCEVPMPPAVGFSFCRPPTLQCTWNCG
jgi:hypothetical protein